MPLDFPRCFPSRAISIYFACTPLDSDSDALQADIRQKNREASLAVIKQASSWSLLRYQLLMTIDIDTLLCTVPVAGKAGKPRGCECWACRS